MMTKLSLPVVDEGLVTVDGFEDGEEAGLDFFGVAEGIEGEAVFFDAGDFEEIGL